MIHLSCLLKWLVAILPIVCLTAVSQAESTHFRKRGGVADASALPADLGDKSVQEWRVPIGPGISTPCVCDERIFVTTWDAEKKELATVALRRSDGKVLWTRVAPTKRIEPFHRTGSPAASTPACDGERLYSFFGSYGLLCYDLGGKLLWKQPLGPFQDEFGAASSPVLAGDLVILNEDHDIDSFLVAFNNRTGKKVWKTPRPDATRSYSTPLVIEQDGKLQLIVAGALRLSAYDAKSGRRVWWVNGLSRIVDTTPILADGRLFVATWTPGGDVSSRIAMEAFDDALKTYDKNADGEIAKTELTPGAVLTRFFRIDLNQNKKLDRKEWDRHAAVFARAQNVAIAVKPGGKGDVTSSHVEWTHRRGLPTVPSPVVYDGVMYMVKDGGIITSLEAKTGKPIKQGRARGPGAYYASAVAADGKVYLASERGVVTVLKAGGEWDVLSLRDFNERILATPVIAGGRIYVRTDKALYSFGKQ